MDYIVLLPDWYWILVFLQTYSFSNIVLPVTHIYIYVYNLSWLFLEQWTLRGLCIGEYFCNLIEALMLAFWCIVIIFPGFIIFVAVIWVLQEKTKFHILRYVILFIGISLSLLFFPLLQGKNFLICIKNSLFDKSLKILLGRDKICIFDLTNCRCHEQFVFSLRYVNLFFSLFLCYLITEKP